MMTNNFAFNVFAILINLVSAALQNNIGTDIDMLQTFVKIPLRIHPDLLYFPFFQQIYNLVEITSGLT